MNIKLFIQLGLAVVIILTLLGFSGETINGVSHLLFAIILPSLIISAITGSIIEGFGGGFLKAYSLNLNIFGISFSISFFIIAVVIFKFIIFS